MILQSKKLIASQELQHCRFNIEHRVREDMRKEIALTLLDKMENGKVYMISKEEFANSLLVMDGSQINDGGDLARECLPGRRADLILYSIITLEEVE